MTFNASKSKTSRPGLLTRAVSAAARTAARRPRVTIVLWLLLIVGCTFAGSLSGTKSLSDAASGTGESAHAEARITAAGLRPPAFESVLLSSGTPSQTTAAATELERRLAPLGVVAQVQGPFDSRSLSADGGRVGLVRVRLRGDPDNAGDHVAAIERTVADVGRSTPAVRIRETGDGSIENAFNQITDHDLHRAELIALPITLVILALAFGALVAASVPLLLGLTSVAAALGALGLVSQIAPTGDATASVVVLIGLAVGVDYSLFYIRREREERRAGAGREAALEAAASTVGRAVVVAGLTVVVALSGLLFTGLGVFTSMGLAAIVVVLIAVLGSLTVLPATLALLGDRIDRGRLLRGRLGRRPSEHRVWTALAGVVTRHPRASLVSAVCLLGILAVPLLGMHTANPGDADLPAGTPVLSTEYAIDHWFPGAPVTADVVVTGRHLGSPQAARGLRALGRHALARTGGRGEVTVSVARNARTAVVSVPAPERGIAAEQNVVSVLRKRVDPTAARIVPGAHAELTGQAASDVDFANRLSTATPIVIGFVLALAFMLLLIAFRSPLLAASVIGLNLLSVGAAFGMLVAVFQHHWAQSALGFTSDGAIVSWLPLFAFVILFGLSMDYTVLVLERVRERRQTGDDARTAVARATASTAGTVTSAALVMIAVFAVFATLRLLEFKQLGFGLAAAIALDATIVRGIALPAAVTLLGERGWKVPGAPGGAPPQRRPQPARRRQHAARPPLGLRVRQATTRFARDLAYLTVGLVTSVISFGALVGGMTASLVLAPFVVGAPVFAATARMMRGVADLDRLNARLLLRRPLQGRYQRPDHPGVIPWIKSAFRDPQTWRDLGWSALHSVVGFTFGVTALSLIAGMLGMVSLPIWYWSVPHPDFIGLWQSNTLPRALAVVPIVIPTLLVTMQLVRLMAACEVRLAAALLDRRGVASVTGARERGPRHEAALAALGATND